MQKAKKIFWLRKLSFQQQDPSLSESYTPYKNCPARKCYQNDGILPCLPLQKTKLIPWQKVRTLRACKGNVVRVLLFVCGVPVSWRNIFLMVAGNVSWNEGIHFQKYFNFSKVQKYRILVTSEKCFCSRGVWKIMHYLTSQLFNNSTDLKVIPDRN